VRIELPDESASQPPQGLSCLDLACELYARERVGKVAGSQLAGVDFFTFQRALAERHIPSYTETMLTEDLNTLNRLFPS